MVGHEGDGKITANPYNSPTAPSEHVDRSPPTGFSWGTASLGCGAIAMIALLLLPNVRFTGGAARRAQCTNNLKQIGIALRQYHDTYKTFPPAYTVDASGRKLHSWRTLILPWLEQSQLYDSIDFSKPWDDPANAKVYAQFPVVYQCPSNPRETLGCQYFALVCPGGFLQATQGVKVDSNEGGPHRLLVIEAPIDRAVHWMEPVDADDTLLFAIDEKSQLSHNKGFQVVCFDGSVRYLSAKTSADTRRKLISGEAIDDLPN